MKTKDLFVLAVRLLGLYFFYVGLKDLDVPALMDVTIVKGDNLEDLISTLLPVAFNLAVAWWLLGCAFLIRRAYPDSPRPRNHFPSPTEPAAPASQSKPVEELTGLEIAERKLATLVGKPKNDASAK